MTRRGEELLGVGCIEERGGCGWGWAVSLLSLGRVTMYVCIRTLLLKVRVVFLSKENPGHQLNRSI